MTRINRPDTLLTELREIKRRLRLLEAARMLPGSTALAAAALAPTPTSAESAQSASVPLMPARPIDWPGTASPEWEPLAVIWSTSGGQLLIQLVADDGDTTGEARTTVDGAPFGDPFPVTPTITRHTIALPAATEPDGAEIAVEAHRTAGTGTIRASASFRPSSTEAS